VVWTIVRLPALSKQVHYRNYWTNVYGASKEVQCGIYCVSPVVDRGSSAAMVKEETKLAALVINQLNAQNLVL